ncbi:MAG: addiction module antidote protein [Sphingomonadaceae bacterium]
MPLETKPFDAARYIETPEDAAALIADAVESGDAGHIAHALGIIARARGMAEIATETGINRTALYASLSKRGNPSLDTLLKIASALKLKVALIPG